MGRVVVLAGKLFGRTMPAYTNRTNPCPVHPQPDIVLFKQFSQTYTSSYYHRYMATICIFKKYSYKQISVLVKTKVLCFDDHTCSNTHTIYITNILKILLFIKICARRQHGILYLRTEVIDNKNLSFADGVGFFSSFLRVKKAWSFQLWPLAYFGKEKEKRIACAITKKKDRKLHVSRFYIYKHFGTRVDLGSTAAHILCWQLIDGASLQTPASINSTHAWLQQATELT